MINSHKFKGCRNGFGLYIFPHDSCRFSDGKESGDCERVAGGANRHGVPRRVIFDSGYFGTQRKIFATSWSEIPSSTPFDYRVHRHGARTSQSLVRLVKLKGAFLQTAQKSCVAMVLNGTYHSSLRYYGDRVGKKLYKVHEAFV